MNKKTILFVTLFIISTSVIFGQEDAEKQEGKLSGGSGGFYMGFKQYNTGNYDYFLPEGTSGFENGLITIGGGGYGIYNSWMLGGHGFFRGGDAKDIVLNGPLNEPTAFNYQIIGGGGYLTLGYAMFHTDNMLVFPQLGVGFESLSVEKTVDEDISYQDDKLLASEYSWASPMLDIGAGIDFFPFKDSGLKLGLRVGYQLSTERGNNDWNHEGGELSNNDLPDNNLDGFYVNIIIGGGYFGEK